MTRRGEKTRYLEWLLGFACVGQDFHRFDRDLGTVDELALIHIAKSAARYGVSTAGREI